MAERLSLTPRYTAGEAAPAWRLALEPERVDRREALADLADIDAMLAAVASGGTARARQLDRCRWAEFLEDGRLRVTLKLFVWPSDPAIPYALSVPEGVEAGPGILEERPVSRKVWVSGATLIDLPWMLKDARVGWIPGLSCYDAESREMDPPAARYVAAGARLGVAARTCGLLAVSGLAVGWAHDIVIHYDKLDIEEGELRPQINAITAEDVDVSCDWRDEAGAEHAETATLAIPPCVKTLLARCSDGTRYVYRINRKKPGHVTVYYNTCDGRVLAVHRAPATNTGGGT